MKKIILASCLLMASFQSFAQQTNNDTLNVKNGYFFDLHRFSHLMREVLTDMKEGKIGPSGFIMFTKRTFHGDDTSKCVVEATYYENSSSPLFSFRISDMDKHYNRIEIAITSIQDRALLPSKAQELLLNKWFSKL